MAKQDAPRQLLERRHQLGAGVSGADDDEGEQLSARPRVLGQRGGLEQVDDVIPDLDRVAGGLERERVLGDSRHHCDVGARAQRQDQPIVLNLLPERGPAVARDQLVTPEINGFDKHLAELYAPRAAEGTDRVDDVPRLDRAGRRLGEHRREEEEVSVADEGDVDGQGARTPLRQLEGGRDAGEPSTHDENPRRERRRAPGENTADRVTFRHTP